MRFRVLIDGKAAAKVDLSGAHLVGSDGVPVRAEIAYKHGEIICTRTITDPPVGLAVLWPVPGVGRVMLETTRLRDRPKPYVLQLELARNRLMRLSHKQEDWEVEDPTCWQALTGRVADARDLLIKALQADNEAEAARCGDESLAQAVRASEELTLEHAATALSRRRQESGVSRRPFGCRLDPLNPPQDAGSQLVDRFDFVTVPFSWRQVEPAEQQFNWDPFDKLVESLAKHRIPMKGTGLVDFSEGHVPEWLFIWEHDFETIRDLVYEHVRRVINRYGKRIQVWDVITGIHGINCVAFNFEQLMELTRMAASVTKQLQPKSMTVIDLVAPWGEYYARNQRTIPPMLYADMAIQSGITFDAFGIQLYLGLGLDGMFVRDLFQVSSLLDRFASRGKPLHITGVQVPSATTADPGDAWRGNHAAEQGGQWWEKWSEELQSRWLRSFYEIALSKEMVDSITWRDLSDNGRHFLPHGGLLRQDLTPKPAYEQLQALRKSILGDGG